MWLICTSCREDWLAQLIAELDDTDSYEYVKHLTDVHRLHLFDIVMQYRAIFFDSSMQVCVCVCQPAVRLCVHQQASTWECSTDRLQCCQRPCWGCVRVAAACTHGAAPELLLC